MFSLNSVPKQECIPVGCILPTLYLAGGVFVQGGLCPGVSVLGVSVWGVSVRETPSPYEQNY